MRTKPDSRTWALTAGRRARPALLRGPRRFGEDVSSLIDQTLQPEPDSRKFVRSMFSFDTIGAIP